jgi:isopenicillin N synthase-like dioxygenase
MSPPPQHQPSTTKGFHIPTIDISPYLEDASTDAARRVVDDVRNACMTAGFFSLVGHGIPREMQHAVLDAARRFFDLPLAEKEALRHPLIKNRGYEIIGSQTLQEDTLPDLKEVRTIIAPPNLAYSCLFSRSLFLSLPVCVCTVYTYIYLCLYVV